jgi:hypothetical protein
MTLAALVTFIVVVVLIGLALWVVETQTPLTPGTKTVLRVVVLLALILYALRAFGVV